MVFASSHLLLITIGAIIGGAGEFISLLVTSGGVIGGARQFTSVVSD